MQEKFNPNVYYDYADSRYELNKKEKATPYYLSYWAAWLQRPYYEDPVVPVIVYPKPKRTFFVVMVLVLMLAVIAVAVLSFTGVVPQLALFEKINSVEDAADNQQIGVDDIVYSTLKSFSMEVNGDILFYYGALRDVETASTPVMIAYYAIPAALILTILIALYILIKAIIALTSEKRRRFSYISLILLLFSLLGVVGGFIWNAQPTSQILNFIMRKSTNITLGFGYMAIVGLEILALIFSLFAYRSKKVTGGK